MKKLLTLLVTIVLLVACNNKKDSKTTGQKDEDVIASRLDSVLITDSSWGPIRSADNFESLKTSFGLDNVKDERICGPECVDSINVTIIYAGTPRELTIYWQDSAYHQKIERVQSEVNGSPYHTASGLRVGSTLQDVLRINGSKISFSGFGWDYGGYISSYGEGALGRSQFGIRLDLGAHPSDEGLYGDRELDTDMPLVKKHMDKIVVSDFTLSFLR